MAGSRSRNLLGVDVTLHVHPDFVPARAPGPLGVQDAGDPERISTLGDTPGPVGLNDHGDPNSAHFRLVPPLNFQDSTEYQVFESMVLDAHIKRAQLRRPRALDIPRDQLEVVEGGLELRKGAAQTCRALLQQARTDLANEKAAFLKKSRNDQEQETNRKKAKGEVAVNRVERIGITSAYRGFAHDSKLWHSYFRKKYYTATFGSRQSFSWWEGGEHGWKAVESTVCFVGKRKAAPGFSNHTNGVAVDFYSIEDGHTLQAETGKSDKDLAKLNARWEKSWLYQWLEAHKSQYGVERISTEAWHWEFRQ